MKRLLYRCVRCGEEAADMDDLEECPSCGEYALLTVESAFDLLNSLYLLRSEDITFSEFVKDINENN